MLLLLARGCQRRWLGLRTEETSRISIHIDGSCRGNNTKELSSRRGGIGIWFGDDSSANISEEFRGPPPITSNRAELWALIRTLQLITESAVPEVSPSTEILIRADSLYVIVHAARMWRQAGRQRTSNEEDDNTKTEEEDNDDDDDNNDDGDEDKKSHRPANRDLWNQVEELMDTAKQQQRCIDFSFVGRADNEGADKLAKDASDKQQDDSSLS